MAAYRPSGTIARKLNSEEVRDRIETLITAHRTRLDRCRELQKLRDGSDAIDLPKDAPNRTEVRAMRAEQQITLLKGTLEEIPRVRCFTTSGGEEAKQDTQEIEDFANNAPRVMMDQSGEASFSMALDDAIALETGVLNLVYLPSRLADGQNGMPTLDDSPDALPADRLAKADAYKKGRGHALMLMGASQGQFPIVLRSVNPMSFFWSSDPELGGLTETVEIRTKRAIDLVDDPRYQRNAKPLVAYVKDKLRNHASGINALLVYFAIYETRDRTYTFCSGELLGMDKLNTTGDAAALSHDLPQAWQDGVLVLDRPNKLGRPHYVLFPGMTVTSDVPTDRHRAVTWASRHLMRRQDTLLSAAWTEYLNFAFAPVAVTQEANPNGPGIEEDVLEFESGYHKVKVLPPGVGFQFITNPQSRDSAALWMAQQIERLLDSHGIPLDVLNPSGDPSGYRYNSTVQNLMSRYAPLVRNTQSAWVRVIMLLFDIARLEVGEPLPISGWSKRKQRGEWYTLDPEKLDGLTLNIEPIFGARKAIDDAASIQNYTMATQGENPLYDRETARQKLVGEEDSQRIEEALIHQKVLDDPRVHDLFMTLIATKAVPQLFEQYANAQGDITPEALSKASSGLQQAFLADQQGQNPGGLPPGPPPPQGGAVPTSTRPTPPTTPLSGGRRAGGKVQPGGPKRVQQSLQQSGRP